jgi:hypothetical protein
MRDKWTDDGNKSETAEELTEAHARWRNHWHRREPYGAPQPSGWWAEAVAFSEALARLRDAAQK